MWLFDKISGLFLSKATRPNSRPISCRNCGHTFSKDTHGKGGGGEIFTTCPRCGASWVRTWRELGLDIEDNCDGIRLWKNPNPQRIQFGVEIGDIITPATGKNIFDLLNVSDFKNGGGDTSSLTFMLECCADAEEGYKAIGLFPAPQPYQEVAEEARFHADYKLELAICNRFIDLINFEVFLQKKLNKMEVNVKGMPFYNIACDRIKIIPSLKKNKTPSDKKYIFNKKEFSSREKKQKLFLQCLEYNIPIDSYDVSYSRERRGFFFDEKNYFRCPSDTFLHHLKNQGWCGTGYKFTPIMQLIQASCLDYLEETSRKLTGIHIPDLDDKIYYKVNPRVECSESGLHIISGGLEMENFLARSFHEQIKLYDLNMETVIDKIKSASDAEMFSNWRKIMSDRQVKQLFPRLKENDVASVFDILGRKKLSELATELFLSPEGSAIGWPDIWAVKGGKLVLYVVKSNNCLQDTQIRTFTTIIQKHGFDTRVVRLKKVDV